MEQLKQIKGVGDKTLILFNKLNIKTKKDLLNYYPFRYEIIKKSDIKTLNDNDKIIIDGIVESNPMIYNFGRKTKRISFRINEGSKIFNIVAFNQTYLLKELKIGKTITIIGKYIKKNNTIVCNKVRFSSLEEIPKIESVYHTTNGLKMSTIKKIIKNALEDNYNDFNYIPKYLEERYGFIDKNKALKEIHFPTNIDTLKKARIRLKYEELFIYMLKIIYLKIKGKEQKSIRRNFSNKDIQNFIKKIPFSLTIDQIKAKDEILKDLKSEKRMNRLLQGDVGSGKTIVAFISAYANFLSGYQTAIMVPTEILANQHYENALRLFKGININIALLTSNTKKKEKKEILENLKKGNINFIIGTQSLIQDDIKYFNLGLIITDEQHRFGVNQRTNLKNKGITPDVLSMSATPIPRTYALTIYGDLDVSNIKTKPVGRKEIITKIYLEKEIIDVLNLINEQLKLNHQIYVIAPMIEDMNEDLESVYSLEEKMNKAFGKKYKIDIVHGKLEQEEKMKVMNDFFENKINILISTTVIEVGLDVKNASTIVIFNANKFGLSTLHQLRGRVGRSDIQSYCVLIEKEKNKRLDILEKTNDGFEISEFDFETRGEGELFGIRQSGMNNFLLSDIRKDYKLLVKTKEDAKYFIENNEIKNHPNIIKLLSEIFNLE